jgi:hypothetical protein
MISCELILASKNEQTGDILYTFKQRFPRIILAETNTHMIAAKNAASSRALPTLRQLKNILNNPFLPHSIGQYQKGMQAGQEIQGLRRWLNEQIWLKSRFLMVFIAWLCYKLGAPKQFSNRLVEPWMWVEQIWTSTDVNNELLLRNHWMAEPHYQLLMKQKQEIIERVKAHFAGTPDPGLVRRCQVLKPGEWHMPFLQWWDFQHQLDEVFERRNLLLDPNRDARVWDEANSKYVYIEGLHNDKDIAKAVSAARCAWVSYYMPGDASQKMNNILAALLTYHKLASGKIRHLSPLMHVATPLPFSVRVGSHCGWLMFRKELEGESGGDKVVCSITPAMAKTILHLQSSVRLSREALVNVLSDLFIEELETQLNPTVQQFKAEPQLEIVNEH